MKLVAKTLFAVALMGVSISSWAQTLSVSLYNGTAGGVNIQAEYDLGPNPCCPSGNVRWLQRVKLTKPDGSTNNDVPGFPNGDFIDPLPNGPNGPWDNDPWYDVTYATAANRTSDTNRQNGAGRFYNDSPNGWGPFGPMTFTAWTAIVCINDENHIAEFMGGFTWSFTVGAAGGITPTSPTGLGNTAATVGLFNNALQSGPSSFQQWTINTGDPNCQTPFVPEPASMAPLALGMLVVLRRRGKRG